MTANDLSIRIASPATDTPLRRAATFFGHFDARLYLNDGAYVDAGRGSMEAAYHLTYVSQEATGCVGTVGQFCDFAGGVRLFAGGAHRNELPINIVFSGVPLFSSIAMHRGIEALRTAPAQPFRIGNAVVISDGVRILPGADVGDGAVLAAGSVVTGHVEPFTIAGGVPSRLLRPRFDATTLEALLRVRWWDFDTAYLLANLERLQELALRVDDAHVYQTVAVRFAWRISPGARSVSLLGIVQGDALVPLEHAPASVRDYVAAAGMQPEGVWQPGI